MGGSDVLAGQAAAFAATTGVARSNITVATFTDGDAVGRYWYACHTAGMASGGSGTFTVSVVGPTARPTATR